MIIWGVQRQRSISATLARIVKGLSLFYVFTLVVSEISPYNSYSKGRTALAYCRVWDRPTLHSASLNQKLCFGWYALLFAGMKAIFTYNLCKLIEEAYDFHDPCLSVGDAPLSMYSLYLAFIKQQIQYDFYRLCLFL